MDQRAFILFLTFIYSVFAAPYSAWAKLVIHTRVAVAIELVGFETLKETTLFKGKLAAGGKQELETPYRGLVLLVFTQGQTYPLIIGNESLTVRITSPAEPPTFVSSKENESLYKALTNNIPVPEQYPFAALIIRARNLLDSSHSIHTVAELRTWKKEFQQFVAGSFFNLKHTDMVRRLIAQSFMMHEYVDYHEAGTPASEIKKRYQQEILTGVADWLRILSPHIPEQEIVNYCVALYFDRSMVTLATLIIDRFKDIACCPGDGAADLVFPDDLQILQPGENGTKSLGGIKGNKLMALVSEKCPVSLAAAVSKARQLTRENQPILLIVVPMEKLAANHLAMTGMIRNGNLLFVSDDKWRNGNLTKKITLPMFIPIQDN